MHACKRGVVIGSLGKFARQSGEHIVGWAGADNVSDQWFLNAFHICKVLANESVPTLLPKDLFFTVTGHVHPSACLFDCFIFTREEIEL